MFIELSNIRSNISLKFDRIEYLNLANLIRFDSIYIHRIRIIRRFDRSSRQSLGVELPPV